MYKWVQNSSRVCCMSDTPVSYSFAILKVVCKNAYFYVIHIVYIIASQQRKSNSVRHEAPIFYNNHHTFVMCGFEKLENLSTHTKNNTQQKCRLNPLLNHRTHTKMHTFPALKISVFLLLPPLSRSKYKKQKNKKTNIHTKYIKYEEINRRVSRAYRASTKTRYPPPPPSGQQQTQ